MSVVYASRKMDAVLLVACSYTFFGEFHTSSAAVPYQDGKSIRSFIPTHTYFTTSITTISSISSVIIAMPIITIII